LVFESGILSESTAVLSQNTHSYLANAVGMSAGVAPTELNQYTAQLTQKERELAAREASLEEREIAVNLSTAPNSSSNDRATYILSGILFILLVLILLNYALDYLRRKETQQPQTV
jgi:ABC-type Na+ efflux pump permease subunit